MTQSSVLIRIRATAHTPEVGGIGLRGDARAAKGGDVHAPREGRTTAPMLRTHLLHLLFMMTPPCVYGRSARTAVLRTSDTTV